MYRYLHRIHISSHSYLKAILMGEGFQITPEFTISTDSQSQNAKIGRL